MDHLSSLSDKTISLLFLITVLTNGPIKLYGQVNGVDLIFNSLDLKNCFYSKRNSMYQVTCNNLGMRKIPDNLKNDIQVGYFDGNYLRTLRNDAFEKYPKLSYISLEKSAIQKIDSGAFLHQDNLIALNLHENLIAHLEPNIFENTNLQTLYLGMNELSDEDFNITIDSNINFLDISENHLTRIPNLKHFYYLKYLNVSNNAIVSFGVDEIASFCYLDVLDVTSVELNLKQDHCCELSEWILLKKIKLFPTIKCNNCKITSGNSYISNKTLEIFDECRQAIKMKHNAIKMKKIITYIGLGFIAIIIIVLIIFIYGKKRVYKKSADYKIDESRDFEEHNIDDVDSQSTSQFETRL
ncbi:toll-like receptor Tollo [Aphidius gifuensis]|nr:toll-like receptor Tollo [Aphidius gifuensis]